jgi:hypothetical protein
MRSKFRVRMIHLPDHNTREFLQRSGLEQDKAAHPETNQHEHRLNMAILMVSFLGFVSNTLNQLRGL